MGLKGPICAQISTYLTKFKERKGNLKNIWEKKYFSLKRKIREEKRKRKEILCKQKKFL